MINIKKIILISVAIFFCKITSQAFYVQDRPAVDSLINLYNEARTEKDEVLLLIKISEEYGNINVDKAILYAEEALIKAEKTNNEKLLTYALFNAANAATGHGLYERAINYLIRAYDFFYKNNDKLRMAYTMANIGAVRLKLKNYQEAKSSFLKVISIMNIILDSTDNAEILPKLSIVNNNLGIAYEYIGKYDSSLYYYQKALESDDPNVTNFIDNIFNNIGNVYLRYKNYDSAFVYAEKAFRIRQEKNNYKGLCSSHQTFYKIYYAINEKDSALIHLRKAYNINNYLGSLELETELSENFYTYYSSINNSDSALYYLEQYHSSKLRLDENNAKNELKKLDIELKLKEQKSIHNSEQQKMRMKYIVTIGVLSFSIVIFILAFLLLKNRFQKLRLDKDNMQLQLQNAQLEKINLTNKLELKNKELTTQVMSMIQKDEMINEIIKLLEENSNKETSELISKVTQELNNNKNNNLWEEFEMRYNQVHSNFYDTLNEKFPELSVNERRLCAFLRLNMTTKEISYITKQSIRSIEVARTRLRKKLNITNSKTSLTEFLNSL